MCTVLVKYNSDEKCRYLSLDQVFGSSTVDLSTAVRTMIFRALHERDEPLLPSDTLFLQRTILQSQDFIEKNPKFNHALMIGNFEYQSTERLQPLQFRHQQASQGRYLSIWDEVLFMAGQSPISRDTMAQS